MFPPAVLHAVLLLHPEGVVGGGDHRGRGLHDGTPRVQAHLAHQE